MKNDNKNVFISHIHEDDSKLKELKGLLSKNGINARDYSINADKENKAKDKDYIKYQILSPKIRQASVMIVYISPETKNSEYVNWEIEYAHNQGKRVIGVWGWGEKGCKTPEALEDYGDALVGWNGENIVDAITGNSNNWYNQDGKQTRNRSDMQYYNC